MGIKSPKNHPQEPTVTETVTNSNPTVSSNIITNSSALQSEVTLKGGQLLGILRPIWIKTTESEERIRWFRQMIERKLLVRDIEAFLQNTCDKLRSEESKVREEEREVLMRLMILKRNDERRHLRELKKEKESLRTQIKKEYGRKTCYTLIVKKLRREIRKRRMELREKYNRKIEHLTEVRKKEIEYKKREGVPKELEFYRECLIFDGERLKEREIREQEVTCIGEVDLDADEKAILRLNPNFAVMKCLDEEEIERDVELAHAKLRYELRRVKEEKELEEYEYGDERKMKQQKKNIEKEIFKERDKEDLQEARSRMIFDPTKKVFDYANRRVTDLKENTRITLPKAGSPKEEAELEMMRKIVIEEFNKYKKEVEETNTKSSLDQKKNKRKEKREKEMIAAKERNEDSDNIIEKEIEKETEKKDNRNQEWKNLTSSERRGLIKLRKRIKDEEIVILRTDKSGKLTAMKKEEYLKMGRSKIEKDKKMTRKEIKDNEERINAHTRMILKIVNAGESHGHLKRITNSKITHSETSAPMYYMYKDHKKGGGWRPVVSGCNSNTLGLSNLLSDMVESICGSL